jgi:hypothetical protein
MKQLEANEYAVQKVMSREFQFRVPEYQRPYAWETEQALQLFDDLTGAFEQDTDEPYFLGSIVLVKASGVPESEVIDGQQRLTTLSILLAVIRDLVADEKFAEGIDELLREQGNVFADNTAYPRLSLRNRDTDFFETWVQHPGNIEKLVMLSDNDLRNDAQKAVRDNAKSLLSRLERWTQDQLTTFVKRVVSRTYLVVVSTPDLQSAHRIFSVMNSRGLDLSPADIFKSLVIGDLMDDGTEAYAEKWEDAEQDLGREPFADLFLHIRMIYAKERGRRELLKEFPEQVLTHFRPDKGKEFVDDVVVPYAAAYGSIEKQDYSAATGAESVNQWLKRLVQLDNNDWRPVALWAMRHHGNDPVLLSELLANLERLAASMLLRRVYATPRAQRYAELLAQLDGGAGVDAPAFQLTDEEKADTRKRLDGEIYLVTKVRKYVLLRLDEAIAQNPGVSYDHKIITVEHVLPQQPAADSEWLQAFDTAQRDYWTHRLGNLLLLNRTKNAEAQNYDFEKKKEKYFSSKNGVSKFALTTQVLNTPVWTPEVVRRRHQDLLGVLVREWGL